ncbi:MAG: merA1, partial [Hyphomicrobiales bacterium]|nr:merA1 [Hyphomicrobiales bacterium]
MAALLDPDICIIGAGPAGLAVATAARAHGASVVLVAREPEGGERVRAGSAASKAFVAAARHAHAMRNAGAFGLAAVEPVADYARVQAHVQQVVDGMARDNSVERFEALGIKLVAGTAKFLDPKTIKAGDTLIRARRFVLATGSRPS